MKIYRGDRTIDGIVVYVDKAPLNPRFDLAQHSDLGFEWTYVGAESRQLAFAILMDHLGDVDRARNLTEEFLVNVVANLNNSWTMTGDDVDAALADAANRGNER